jgi:hypothetical protein
LIQCYPELSSVNKDSLANFYSDYYSLFQADQCDECKAAVTQFHTLVTTNSTKVLEILNNVCAGLKTGSAEVITTFLFGIVRVVL